MTVVGGMREREQAVQASEENLRRLTNLAAANEAQSIERARQMPGREKEVWDYYRNNANALAQLRAPIYEDKVVDFILELANVTEKKVSREDLFKDDEDTAAA